MGVPPAARMPFLHLHRQVAQIVIAGHGLDPRIGDADDRLGRSSSVKPMALSMARAGARSRPWVMV
jgi:hypothetical protein